MKKTESHPRHRFRDGNESSGKRGSERRQTDGPEYTNLCLSCLNENNALDPYPELAVLVVTGLVGQEHAFA